MMDQHASVVWAGFLLLAAAACSLPETVSIVRLDDASATDAKGGAAGTRAAGGSAGNAGAGSVTTGNLGGSGGGGTGGSAGSGGSADSGSSADSDEIDGAAADLDVGVDVPPPIVCPPMGIEVGTGRGLVGQYFIGQDLTNLKVTRYDPSVDFEWGLRAPEAGVPHEHFSVRWTGQVQPRYSGPYTFITNSDDGVRLTVNNVVVIDNFTDHGVTENVGTPIDLVAGQKYDIKMEYYQNTAGALARLSWQSDCQTREVIPTSQLYYTAPVCGAPMVGTGTGLKGEYYDNLDLTNLLATHPTEGVDFTWSDVTMPDPAVAPGTYSVRWTGQVQAKLSEPVTFYTTSDDGVRLFVDDVLVIDDWTNHGPTEDAGTVALVAGQNYNLRLEFYNDAGGGQIKLSWGSGCVPREVIPPTQLFATYTGVVCLAPSVGTGAGLKGEYFNTLDFMDLKVTRAAEIVNFDFGGNAPDPTVGATNFSIRWTGQVQARYSGPTTFRTVSDDGARLWLGGALVIDNWTVHPPTENTAVVTLTVGQKYDVRLDYYQDMGGSQIRLLWSGPCQALEAIPATMLYNMGYTGLDAGSAADAGTD
jgi:hypothetical protein